MIVKMSKYAFMVYHREYDAFLTTLRELGVVHVKETNSILDNAELQALLTERKQVSTAIRYCKSLNSQTKGVTLAPARELTKAEGLKLVGKLEEMQEKQVLLQAEKASLEKDIAYMDIWGEFSYANIRRLKKAGFDVTFFSCPTSKYEPKWGEEYNAFLVNNFQSVTYFVTVTKVGTPIDIDAERPKMPDRGLAKLHLAMEQLLDNIKALNNQLKEYAAGQYNTLVELEKNIQNEFNLSNTLMQTDREAGDKLMLLEGFVPTEEALAMEAALEKDGYYFQELDIQDGDRVPIKLKNNKFSRLYEPITKMFSLPNYAEFDPTPFFAPFFMLFFGLCFGDGGYGLLVIIACAIMKRKVGADFKPYLSLFQYLGLAALVVGTCTGSFFGIALVDVPAFASVKDYFVNSDNLMTFSIIIGLVQCCAFGLPMLNVQLSDTVKNVFLGVAAAGLLVAFLYNSPGKNIFLNFGTGLWNTYNMASGLLGDTLSYIRLFAIGLTGAILGGVFNSLAIDMTEGMNVVLRAVCMLLILLVGHAINIGLCTISSLVHPLRLIFVEYYKNAEFEGGGKEYKPFKKA